MKSPDSSQSSRMNPDVIRGSSRHGETGKTEPDMGEKRQYQFELWHRVCLRNTDEINGGRREQD